jgi:hypothetical protein
MKNKNMAVSEKELEEILSFFRRQKPPAPPGPPQDEFDNYDDDFEEEDEFGGDDIPDEDFEPEWEEGPDGKLYPSDSKKLKKLWAAVNAENEIWLGRDRERKHATVMKMNNLSEMIYRILRRKMFESKSKKKNSKKKIAEADLGSEIVISLSAMELSEIISLLNSINRIVYNIDNDNARNQFGEKNLNILKNWRNKFSEAAQENEMSRERSRY